MNVKWWLLVLVTLVSTVDFAQAQRQRAKKKIEQQSTTATSNPQTIQEYLNQYTQYGLSRPTEKIYLHKDKPTYTAGETIWMKLYTVVGIENLLSGHSRVAYVELIDPKEQIITTNRVPIINGMGYTDIQLADTLVEGSYRLRAYTNWMRNDSIDYFFDELVDISNARVDQLVTRSGLSDDRHFTVELSSMHQQILAGQHIQYEILSAENKKLKSGRIKTDGLGRVELDYKNEYAGAKLILRYQDDERSLIEKVFKLPKPTHSPNSVQFFPDGGNLLVGALNKLAAKSVQPNGLSIGSVTKIFTRAGDTIARIETNPLGMGSSPFFVPTSDSLFAHTTFADGSETISPLPTPVRSGYSLELNNLQRNQLFVQLNLGEPQRNGKDIYFVVHYLGKVYYASKHVATKASLLYAVPKSDLPNGVLTLSFLDENFVPILERPIFIYHPELLLDLKLSSDQETYKSRQKVTVSLDLNAPPTDTQQRKEVDSVDGQSSVRNYGAFSASVVNKKAIPTVESPNTHAGILSNLLLSADIKGYIENPAYYFRDGVDVHAIDQLLMTQGWRKIDLSVAPDTNKVVFEAEKGLRIAGQAKRLHRTSPASHANLVLMPTHQIMNYMDTVADENGRFVFDQLFYADSVKFFITAKDQNGTNKVDILLDPHVPPALKPHRNRIGERNDINNGHLDQMLHAKRLFAELQSTGMMEGTIRMREIVITRREEPKAPDHSSNMNGPSNADQVIVAADLANCPNMEICLMMLIRGVYFQNGVPYNTRTNAPMQIVLDGMFVDSTQLAIINPSDVASVEVLRSVNYTTVYGSDGVNGVIVITSKIGVDASAKQYHPKGILAAQPPGFTITRTFYKPIYEADVTSTFEKDLRNTIHWEPSLITNEQGKTSFEFYTADEAGDYIITVEGLDLEGRLGRKQITIQVR